MGRETITGNPNTDWFDAHDDFRDVIQQIEGGLPIDDHAAAIDILADGVHDNPELGAYVLDSLVSSNNDELLESFFDTGLADNLGPEIQSELLWITKEDDPAVQVRRLVELVTSDIDHSDRAQKENLPLVQGGHSNDPLSRAPARYQMRDGSTSPTTRASGDGPTNAWPDDALPDNRVMLDYLLNQAKQGDISTLARDFSEAPELWDVMRAADEDALPVLVELANDPTHGPMAISLLHEMGDVIMPELVQATDDNPGVAAAVYWLIEGEQMPSEDLAKSQAGYWIDQLDADELETRFHARQSLLQLGQAAIGPLMDARANAESRDVVEGLIRQMIDGEGGPVTETEGAWAPFGSESGLLTDLVGQTSSSPSSALYLEPDQLRLSLMDPETRLDTLGLLVEIGRPAVSALCYAIWRR